MKIAILDSQQIAGYEIKKLALPIMFPDATIISIRPEHISPLELAKFDLLYLPGIIGENSPYPDLLPKSKGDIIDQAVKENGLVLWTECAPTYYLMENYTYLGSGGEVKERTGLGIIKGKANGPAFAQITRNAQTRLNNNSDKLAQKFRHHVVAEISCSISGQDLYHAIDVNGPELSPSLDNLPFCEVFRYASLPHQPICGVIQERGQGLVMAFSFHAALPLNELPPAIHNRGKEENRWSFLQHQRNRIHAHIERKRVLA